MTKFRVGDVVDVIAGGGRQSAFYIVKIASASSPSIDPDKKLWRYYYTERLSKPEYAIDFITVEIVE